MLIRKDGFLGPMGNPPIIIILYKMATYSTALYRDIELFTSAPVPEELTFQDPFTFTPTRANFSRS